MGVRGCPRVVESMAGFLGLGMEWRTCITVTIITGITMRECCTTITILQSRGWERLLGQLRTQEIHA